MLRSVHREIKVGSIRCSKELKINSRLLNTYQNCQCEAGSQGVNRIREFLLSITPYESYELGENKKRTQ